MYRLLAAVPVGLLLGACSVMPPEQFPRMDSVNVDRYMGGWFVIAHIPPGVVSDSYNNIERYQRGEGNRINTVYTYRDGGFDGEAKRMEPTGFVLDEGDGAVWAMQFIWPIKMEYTIAYVDAAYETTIVARSKRDWVWIMARRPQIDEATYQGLVQRVEALGYNISQLRKVPQQPLNRRQDVDFELATD
ncbi:MAG: hypothetical protein CMH65_13840 [Nevskiales bacterium]|nr:hypothetical protein [Nevskiales bacterium]